jgi:hypothetical protein
LPLQVLITQQKRFNYGCADFKQCISYNEILLQEFNIAFGFIIPCVKGSG